MAPTSFSRRAFLQAASALAAAGKLMEPAMARALETPANNRTGTVMDVEHVVVFMLENRSFDHYFGTMSGVRGFGDRHTVTLPNGSPVWRQPDGKGGFVTPFGIDVGNTNFPVLKSLDHHWGTGHDAFHDGLYDKWVQAKGGLTMGHLTRSDIPYHFALADAFTVCDAYHSSVMGPTCPNRLYLMTGNVDHHNLGGYGPVIDNIDITQKPDGVIFGRGWKTYAERLQDAGVSWRLYRQGVDQKSDDDSDGGMDTLLAFAAFQDAKPGDELYERGVRPRRLEQLKADVIANQLPQVSWIVPPRLFCEHPNWPPAYGVEYLARILDALTANPEVWSKTVFLVMYDENDGYFDHVVPPVAPFGREQGLSTVPTDDERHPEGQPYGLGMRVPMLAISPWSRGGWVCSETFDHTSVIRFLETRFGVHEPNISEWRRTVCGDLTSAFDFRAPNTEPPHDLAKLSADSALPDQATFNAYKAVTIRKPKPVVPLDAPMPVVEPGLRKFRPLGYTLAVEPKVTAAGLRLTFRNTGTLGASFSVSDRKRPDVAAKRYTVSAGKSLSDSWDGDYAVEIHGPSGFYRAFAGPAGQPVGIALTSHDGQILMSLAATAAARTVTVTDCLTGKRASLTIPAGQKQRHIVDLSASGNWYDLAVSDGVTSCQFAGHVETGRSTISDPGLSS